MKKILTNNYFLFAARSFLGFIFIYAAAEKIVDPANFAVSIHNYKLLPLFLINFISVILPWIELTSGMMLVLGIAVKETSFVTGILLIFFIAAAAIALMRGLNIDCGCFGTAGGTKVGTQKIVENLFLLALSANLFFYGAGNITFLPAESKADI
jgi:uncharacterized membrane protein YphA (DoxX/SURF4 family)